MIIFIWILIALALCVYVLALIDIRTIRKANEHCVYFHLIHDSPHSKLVTGYYFYRSYQSVPKLNAEVKEEILRLLTAKSYKVDSLSLVYYLKEFKYPKHNKPRLILNK